jgi:hypothetical protein
MKVSNVLSTTRRKVALGAIGGIACLGIGGTAYAATASGPSSGAPSTSSGAPSTGTTAPAATRHHRSLIDRAEHATVELKVKGKWVTYTLDRGKVTAVSPTSITLARPDGTSVTDAINSATKFRGVTSESGVSVGKDAGALSSNGTALRITQKAATAPSN